MKQGLHLVHAALLLLLLLQLALQAVQARLPEWPAPPVRLAHAAHTHCPRQKLCPQVPAAAADGAAIPGQSPSPPALNMPPVNASSLRPFKRAPRALPKASVSMAQACASHVAARPKRCRPITSGPPTHVAHAAQAQPRQHSALVAGSLRRALRWHAKRRGVCVCVVLPVARRCALVRVSRAVRVRVRVCGHCVSARCGRAVRVN